MCKAFIFASVIVFVSINISNTLNAQQPSPVVLDAVTLEPINQTQTVIGRVVSLKESTVAALLPSAVTKINIKVGQQVKKGESLVVLNLERLYWALEKAKAELKLTEANNSAAVAKSTLAKRVFDRLTSLKSSSAFSQAKYDESIAKYEESKALVAASNAEMIIAEQNFNLAKDDYRLGTIRAPFDGVVEERHIEVGESTTLGTPIVTLVSNSELEIEADTPSSLSTMLVPEQKITIVIDNSSFASTIRSIGNIENPTTRTRRIRLTPTIDKNYNPAVGQNVNVLFPVNNKGQLVTVHKDAILKRQGMTLVYVVEEGVANIRPVKLGSANKERFIVIEGLKTNEQVVIRGNERLRPGQNVVNTNTNEEKE